MDTEIIYKWERSKELAKDCNVKIAMRQEGFSINSNDNELSLGRFPSISDVLSFLCGYEYSIKKGGISGKDRAGKK